MVVAPSTLRVGDETFEIFRLDALQASHDVERLPFTLRVLLENALRTGTEADVEAVASWVATAEPSQEVSFTPARVLHQDFTGVPAVVDLAAMRHAMQDLGGDPTRVEPVLPSDLVIDHSVQVDEYAIGARDVPEHRARVRAKPRALCLPPLGPAGVRRAQGRAPGDGDRPPGEPRVPRARRGHARRPGVPRHARRHRLAHDDDQRPRRARLGRRRDRGGGGDARRIGLDARPAGGRLPAQRRPPRRCDGDRPRADGDADPPRDGRRREVRRILRRRPHRPAGRRSRDAREHVARVRCDLRLLPGRRGDAHVSPPHRPERRADRARRGVLQGEPALAHGGLRAHLLDHRRARPLDRRAEPRRSAPAAGPRAAPRRQGVVPRCAADLRRRLRHGRGRGDRRELPGERRADAHVARPQGVRVHSCRRRARHVGARGRRLVRARRRALCSPPRRGRDRRDHELHEHLQPPGDGRRRNAGEERDRARAHAQAMGEVEPRSRVEGCHRVPGGGGPDAVPRRARLPDRRLRVHDVHRELRAAPRRDLAGGRRRRSRGLRGALREPELRSAHPSRGEGELPRLTSARRRLRARRTHGHRPRRRAARAGLGRRGRLPRRHLAGRAGSSGGDRVGAPPRDVRADVRRRLHGRRALALAGDARRRRLRLGRPRRRTSAARRTSTACRSSRRPSRTSRAPIAS